MVKKGDFIAQIDPRPYQAALDQAQGQLAKDQAALGQAQSDLARYEQLNKQDSIAKQTVTSQQALVAQDKAAIDRRSGPGRDRPAQRQLHPYRLADRREGRACGSSTPAIIFSRPMRPGSWSSPRWTRSASSSQFRKTICPASPPVSRPAQNWKRLSSIAPMSSQARDRNAHDLRLAGRYDHRHDQAARNFRQPERGSVPEPVRERAASGRYAEGGCVGPERGDPDRPVRQFRLCSERRIPPFPSAMSLSARPTVTRRP